MTASRHRGCRSSATADRGDGQIDLTHARETGVVALQHQVAAPGAGAEAADILMADETLRTAYLLRVGGNPGVLPLDTEAAAGFLLWFAVEGRHQYHHVLFSPAYIAFLAAPEPPFPTRLAAYVHARSGAPAAAHEQDLEGFLAWYYVSGVHELRLTPLLVARERQFLAAAHPRASYGGRSLARWDHFRLAVQDRARPAKRPRNRTVEPMSGPRPTVDERAADSPWYAPEPLADLSGLPGINVIGTADGVSGIGEDARALSDVLKAAGVQHSIFNVRYPAEIVTTSDHGRASYFTDRPLYPINVFCLPVFETARLRLACGENLFAGRYNVGYWPWELSNLPRIWRPAFELVDEIWASSRFLLDVFQRLTTRPVLYMPPYVDIAPVTPFARDSLGFSEADVIFLCMFDFNSYVARKNPKAAVDAFRLAFPSPSGRERLLIKTLNGHANPHALNDLQQYVATDERITLVDGELTRGEICGLLQSVDCYVSLHRSEGFGRILAEAMLLGTPVIATDWSGSASFLDADTGFPVSCTLRSVRPDEYIYADGSVWAEPSIEDAARKMQLLGRDRHAIEAITTKAARTVSRSYGLEPAASRLGTWLTAFAERYGPIAGKV